MKSYSDITLKYLKKNMVIPQKILENHKLFL